MSKPHIRNIYVLIIFMIGISGPIGVMVQKERNWNPFRRLSPMPLLFSVQRGRASKVTNLKLIIHTDKGSHAFIFDRKFYKNLGGPHRYKVLFYIKLRWTKFLTDDAAENFMQETFCQNKFKLDYLKNQKVKAIELLTYKNHPVSFWKCPI